MNMTSMNGRINNTAVKVPGSESSLEHLFIRAKVSGSESSTERKVQGTKVPGSELARVLLELQGANWPGGKKAVILV